jgi:hypothetical protein
MGEIANLLVGLATFILSLVVWKSSQRQARSEYTRSLQDAWNAFNTTVLATEENIQAADSLHKSDSTPSGMDRRQLWLSFVLLNALQASYLGMQERLVDESYARRTLSQLLDPLLLDNSFYMLTQERGYHPDFSKYCENRRKALKPRDEVRIEVARKEAMP